VKFQVELLIRGMMISNKHADFCLVRAGVAGHKMSDE
jgi:hypothetical protein